MKKLLVLLFTAAVALGASAGVNNMRINTKMSKTNVKEMKAQVMDRQMLKKGAVQDLNALQLNAFDATARPKTNHALKDGDTYFWDFEDEAQASDWTVLDEDGDGFNWELITGEGFNTHSGAYAMSSASYDNPTYTVLYPNNWLVSPWLPLHGYLAFYACGQDPSYAAEVFGVYIYTASDPEWKQIGADVTVTGNMKLYAYDLSEYEGTEGTLAIVHHNVSDMFRLNVDDITIGDFEYVPEPEPETPTVIENIPDGLNVMTFNRNTGYIASSIFGISAGHTDGKLNVAFDEENGEVYIQNPLWWTDSYDTWVKGTYTVNEDGTCLLSIPTGQYLYWSDSYQYGIQLMWGYSYTYIDGQDPDTGEDLYYLGTAVDDRAEEIEFLLDGNNLYLLNGEGDIDAEFPEWANATGMMGIYSDDLSFISIEFANAEAPVGEVFEYVDAIPADPSADEWYDCGDESGYSRFFFTLPTTDVDGNKIAPEYLSYSIYTDNDEIFTFDYDTYYYDFENFDIYEDLTVIPYEMYVSGYDFRPGYCYFYRTNEGDNPLFEHQIGIQVHYGKDRAINSSNIVYLEVFPDTKVNEINAGKTVANVRYFNVTGQEMAQPEGVTIKVTTYTDGTTSTAKVVK